MVKFIRKKYGLAIRTLVIVFAVIGLKFVAHRLGLEFLSLNPLFSGIVAANVFLMGFLLSGILSDYKESERMPGELAASLEVFHDEAASLEARSVNPLGHDFHLFVENLAKDAHAWFFKLKRTHEVMGRISDLNRFFVALEPFMAPNFIVRLKQEQHSLRRTMIRIHTIRETSFVSSGYLLAEMTTALLTVGLIFVRIDPFYESLFFVGVITFLLIYLILLIRDLDNPFGYYDTSSTEDVSIKPLEDLIQRMNSTH